MRVEAVTLCACFRDKPRFEFESETYGDETVFAVLTGSFTYSLGAGGARRQISAGQMVFCPCGVAFHRTMVTPATFALLHFRTQDALPDGEEPITPGNTRRFCEDLEHLMRHPLCFTPEEEPEVAHFARDLLWLVQTERREIPPLLASAYAALSANPEEEISVRDLARVAGYTEAQYIRLFRRYLGDTPKQCQLSLRMDKAKLLLRSTDLSVSEIAYRVGYQDPLYFSRLFHHRTGYTPRDYRTLGNC